MTFPNNFCIVSTIQNSSVKLVDGKVIIAPSTNKSIVTDVVVSYIKPLEVVYQKPVNEITIKFKPLGFNHFVNNPSDYFKEGLNRDIKPFEDFDEQMDTILNISNKNEQVENLEKYWLSKLKIVELDKIEAIVQDVESALGMAEIAKKHNISRQYLNKIFTRNLGKTPSEYRKVFKFKKALEGFQSVNDLTELSYNCLFYDQSHFIKEFKSLTNMKPSSFFRNIDASKEAIWLFL
ncbi:hypothetical protein LCGC14_2602810 [marine sediment metagenome]|uniref:HTH araC/xylS-type domain-containing protein n=1 Tax=marine sediment metagenome TaxID=412755 RepID=A0A0F9CJ99_9ZZZZ